MIDNESDIYYKYTHTGQYMHIFSYTPWNIKTAWIKTLYNRATKTCTNQKLLDHLWNELPNYVSKPPLRCWK